MSPDFWSHLANAVAAEDKGVNHGVPKNPIFLPFFFRGSLPLEQRRGLLLPAEQQQRRNGAHEIRADEQLPLADPVHDGDAVGVVVLAVSRELREGANHHRQSHHPQDAAALSRLAPRIVLVREEQFLAVFFGEHSIMIAVECVEQLSLTLKREAYSGQKGLGLVAQLVQRAWLGDELGSLKLQVIGKVHCTQNRPDVFRMVVEEIQVHELQEVCFGDGV